MIGGGSVGQRIPPLEENGCMLVRALFLRLLGAVYLVAFASLWVQVHGLVGSGGILPVGEFLERAGSVLGDGAWLRVPTFCWLNSGDAALDIQCGLGTALAIALLAGAAPAAASAGLWALYLSLFTAGQEFLAFQWDLLLLETGFLAILWSPARWRPEWVWPSPSRAVLWLLRWLQFRLMFSSGFVKLASGDPAWRDLRALDFHYETQPLPSWTSWYVHHLPEWFHSGEVLGTFAIELIVPFAIFAGRRARLGAASTFALLQVAIAATGNYGYFNLLVLLLCVPLLDDGCFRRLAVRVATVPPALQLLPGPGGRWGRLSLKHPVTLPVLLLLLLSSAQLAATIGLPVSRPSLLAETRRALAPFRLSSSYGLFAVMTTERPEIVVEGSMDGENWKAYEFKWKPGDPGRAPGFVAPPHAEARLADVVRRPPLLPGRSMVRTAAGPAAPGFPRGGRTDRKQSVSPPEVRAGVALRLPIHRPAGTGRERKLVAPQDARGLQPDAVPEATADRILDCRKPVTTLSLRFHWDLRGRERGNEPARI